MFLPALAAARGVASAFGSASSLAIEALLWAFFLGTGTCVATFFSPRVRVRVAVDVAQLTKLPRRLELPTFMIVPSWTATTGEPAFAKMLIPRRVALETTGTAAFWPRATRRVASRSEMSSAYFDVAWTGNRPCVRPLSEPTRSDGMPPMKRARMSTDWTYQSAWL